MTPSLRTAAAAALLAALVAGCGGESEPAKVREVVEGFGQATARKDYQAICDRYITEELVANVEEIGLPCELAWRKALGDVRRPRLVVRTVAVRESRALVTVRSTAVGQRPSTDTLELVRSGGEWRIGSLTAAREPARTTPPATTTTRPRTVPPGAGPAPGQTTGTDER